MAGAPTRRSGPGRILGADLRARVGAAIALMVGALATAWAGGYWFSAFWLIAALVVHWEWQRLIGGPNQGLRVLCGSAGLVVAAPLAINDAVFWAMAALLIGAAGAALASGARPPRLMPGAGVLYAGAMLVSVCLLRASRPGGLYAIVWLFAVVWGTDVMAFFGGRLVGGPKLWPRLSPAKTWSGFGIGILCGAAAGLLAAPATNSIAALFCFGLATGAVAQGGDLLESALKRRFGVKDSSGLIPGHGGLMDRLDGFTAAAISTAFVGAARYGIVNMAAGVFQW
ncbi:MAG: phosphatidate cytidylyltransferase [Roseiarcus sp.]